MKHKKALENGILVDHNEVTVILADIRGPMLVNVMGGCSYLFKTATTPHWLAQVHALHSRSETSRHCPDFVLWEDRNWNHLVKRVHADHRKEVITMIEKFREKGIKLREAFPYTAESDCVCKRMNETL